MGWPRQHRDIAPYLAHLAEILGQPSHRRDGKRARGVIDGREPAFIDRFKWEVGRRRVDARVERPALRAERISRLRAPPRMLAL
jgi:hypothetical protein